MLGELGNELGFEVAEFDELLVEEEGCLEDTLVLVIVGEVEGSCG